MLRIDIPAVAVVQARLCIQHDAVAIEDILVELTEILGVTRQMIHLRHHRHHHIEGIGPPPVIVHLRVGLKAHHLLGTFHLLLIGLQVIEVDIRLETDLPVAEEHIVAPLTIPFVFPFSRVCLCCSFPLVVLRPTDAVVEHLLILQQLVYLHIPCMVGSIVPERADLCRIVRLPVGVHLPDNLLHLVDRPYLALRR